MESIEVTKVDRYSTADVMSQYRTGGGVKIWDKFNAVPDQERNVTNYSPEEWDRLVAYVAWRRANETFEKLPENASASARPSTSSG